MEKKEKRNHVIIYCVKVGRTRHRGQVAPASFWIDLLLLLLFFFYILVCNQHRSSATTESNSWSSNAKFDALLMELRDRKLSSFFSISQTSSFL